MRQNRTKQHPGDDGFLLDTGHAGIFSLNFRCVLEMNGYVLARILYRVHELIIVFNKLHACILWRSAPYLMNDVLNHDLKQC